MCSSEHPAAFTLVMALSSLCCNAGLGNFTKAVGKGMGNPCFRIIQTHFAKNNNVGDVAAKEQVRIAALPLQKPVESPAMSYDPSVPLFVRFGHSLVDCQSFSERLLGVCEFRYVVTTIL